MTIGPALASARNVFRRGAVALLLILVASSCTYMKMTPPPDADKTFTANNNTCYLATASNLLAGAGYGTGTSVQARAD